MTLELAVGLIIPVLWIAWLVYWWYSARDVKQTRVSEPLGSQLLHRVPLILAGILVGAPRWVPRVLNRRFLPISPVFPVLGTVMLAAGLGFSVWARRHLGRNWSVEVVVKQDHTLIRTGPYRYVRHPIYTGILLAFLGMVIIFGRVARSAGNGTGARLVRREEPTGRGADAGDIPGVRGVPAGDGGAGAGGVLRAGPLDGIWAASARNHQGVTLSAAKGLSLHPKRVVRRGAKCFGRFQRSRARLSSRAQRGILPGRVRRIPGPQSAPWMTAGPSPP